MMQKPLAILFLFFVTFASAQSGGVSAGPGSPAIDTSKLEPYKNLWRFTLQKPGQEEIEMGTWSDELQSTQWNGHAAYKRIQVATYKTKGVSVTTTNVFDARTMAPFTMDSYQDSGNFMHRDFQGSEIKQQKLTTPPGGSTANTEVKLDTAVFDFNGGMYGLLLAAFPLQTGYTARFPAVKEFELQMDWVSFEVEGKEEVEAGAGKKVEAWVVKTQPQPMTFWLTKEKPYIIKLVYEAPNGNVWRWTMV